MSAFAARAATLADLPVVCSWVDDADTLFYLHPRAQFPLTVAQLAEAFAARALNTVLLADGAPVAFANCYRHTPGECAMIGNVIVAPAWRGRGAARALLAAMAQQAIARWQVRELGVSCFNGNVAGLLCYPALGFAPHAVEARQRDGQPVTRWLLSYTGQVDSWPLLALTLPCWLAIFSAAAMRSLSTALSRAGLAWLSSVNSTALRVSLLISRRASAPS